MMHGLLTPRKIWTDCLLNSQLLVVNICISVDLGVLGIPISFVELFFFNTFLCICD